MKKNYNTLQTRREYFQFTMLYYITKIPSKIFCFIIFEMAQEKL